MYFSTIGLTCLEASRTGMPSDGRTDATDQFQALLATGKDLALEPGKSYLISRPLQMLDGQSIYGHGATLKRAAQISTTTTTTVVAGVTVTLNVASAAAFRVGMNVTLLNGVTYDAAQHNITAISGNDITVNTAWTINGSGTSTLYQAGNLLIMGNDCRLHDTFFDGNKSQWTFAKWYHTTDLRLGGHRLIVRGCKIQNSPGEGCQATASRHHMTVEDTYFQDINGNGVHLGGNDQFALLNCHFVNCNLDVNVEHADGCFSSSNLVSDLTITDCFFQNGKSGIGSIDSGGVADTNSHVTLTGNTIRDCAYKAIDMICSTDTGVTDVVLQDSRIYNSGPVHIQSSLGTTSLWPSKIVIEGNLFETTRLLVESANYITCRGNQFHSTADVTNALMTLNNSRYGNIGGNTIVGGAIGINLIGTSAKSNNLHGNTIHAQATNPIVVGAGVTETYIHGNQIQGSLSDSGTGTTVGTNPAIT